MIAMSICFGLILAFTKKTYHKNLDYGNVNLIISPRIKDWLTAFFNKKDVKRKSPEKRRQKRQG